MTHVEIPGTGDLFPADEDRALTPDELIALGVGADYIRPGERPAAWTEMAARLHAAGRSPAQIADELCVDEDTVQTLLLSRTGGTHA